LAGADEIFEGGQRIEHGRLPAHEALLMVYHHEDLNDAMPSRVIAIGDIHGASVALKTLIEAIQPQPEDTIVVLGNAIDRGPDSRD
jgi:hypothetical protein